MKTVRLDVIQEQMIESSSCNPNSSYNGSIKSRECSLVPGSLRNKRLKEAKINYDSILYQFYMGLFFYLIFNSLKITGLYYTNVIISFYCQDMEKLILYETIDNILSLLIIFLGFYAAKCFKSKIYDIYLALLVANSSYKIIVFSYYLSYPPLYISWCVSISKEGLYPIMIVDGLVFLFMVYNGYILKSYVLKAENLTTAIEPMLTGQVELGNYA